ncbi:MAG: glycosyltransferase family 9 protein [Candidatus Methylomirabilales bacterium]
MTAKRVLIVKLSSLGDLIHALPTIHCLKVDLPASITWVVNAAYAPLLRYAADVDEVIPFDRERPLRGLWGVVSELRRREFDLVIDLTGLFKSALISRLARGKVCLGPSYAREFSWLFYQQRIGSSDLDRHAVERYLDVVRAFGLEERNRVFPLTFPSSSLPVDGSQPVVVLIPSARWPTKVWPATSFADLADRLRRDRIRVVMVGGELPSPEDPVGGVEGVVDLRGLTSLAELGGVLERADLIIANDTGPMHLAAALGRKVITLMGPTDPRRTGPYGAGHRILSSFPPCSPCFSKVCRNPAGQICLRDLRPAEVYAAAIEMLRERSADTGRRPERHATLDPAPSTLDPSPQS